MPSRDSACSASAAACRSASHSTCVGWCRAKPCTSRSTPCRGCARSSTSCSSRPHAAARRSPSTFGCTVPWPVPRRSRPGSLPAWSPGCSRGPGSGSSDGGCARRPGSLEPGQVTTGRADRDIPDLQAYYDGWSALHGGFDPRTAFWPRNWLALAYRLGHPLARLGVAPDLVTLVTVVVTTLALPPAAPGGAGPLLAVLVVIVSGLLDNIDGCVAVLTGRTSRWGYVVDSLADRLCDAVYLLALWLAGAPAGLCVAAGGAVVLLEYGRARAVGAGFDEIGVITVGERPTRIVVTCFGLAFAAFLPDYADWSVGAGAAATLGVSVIGAIQFLVVARRALSGRTDELGDSATGQGDEREPTAGMRAPTGEEEPPHR